MQCRFYGHTRNGDEKIANKKPTGGRLLFLLFGLKRGKLFHEAAFTARCIIRMNNATACGTIKVLDCQTDGFGCILGSTFSERETGLLDEGACATPVDAIVRLALDRLADAFDCRLMVSHNKGLRLSCRSLLSILTQYGIKRWHSSTGYCWLSSLSSASS